MMHAISSRLLVMDSPHGRLDSFVARCLVQIAIIDSFKASSQILRTHKRHDNNVSVNATHEDTHHFPVLVALGFAFRWERKAGSKGGFDGRGGGGSEVAELVGSSYYEGAERAWRELHEMDGDHTPGTLDAELLEEGSGNNGFAAGVGVRVEQGASDNRDENNGEAATEDLGAVANDSAAGHGTEIGDYLSYGHGIGAEAVLVG